MPKRYSETYVSGYTYDATTQKWVKEVSYIPPTPPAKDDTKKVTKPTPTSSPSSSSDGKDKKKYREIEYCTLEGDLSLIPTKETIKIKVGQTIYLTGVGTFLSGNYFVTNVNKEVSDNGLSLSITVIKTGFGDSLKEAEKTEKKGTKRANKVKKENTSKDFNVGDKVKIKDDNAVYANNSDGVKIPKWVKKKTLTISKLSDSGDKALLKEVLSWTYTKYLVRE